MTSSAIEPRDDDEGELPPWVDPEPYMRVGRTDFWLGCENVVDGGPLRGWWIRRLYAEVKTHAPDAREDVWARMVMWLAETGQVEEYLLFSTPPTYSPGGSPGTWSIDHETLNRDLPAAFRWAVAAVGVDADPDLDGLLADPLKGLGVAPREPEGRGMLADQQKRAEWSMSTRRRREHWLRSCRTCKQDFRPDTRKAVRCTGCREKDRELKRARAESPEGRVDRRRKGAKS
jgi:hypothetical protein